MDCFEGADGTAAGGHDDGADVGVKFGPSLGVKAVGDFAEGGAGAQCALGALLVAGMSWFVMKTKP
jgi:hypothetical protein